MLNISYFILRCARVRYHLHIMTFTFSPSFFHIIIATHYIHLDGSPRIKD